MKSSTVLGALVALLVTGHAWADEPPRSPLSPEQALKSIRVPDDLRVELFACEPDVVDPVAMAFDENGRVYVVEMRDYPMGHNMGRIKLLEGPDGKGHWKRVTVFADKLPFPNGVLPYRGGVIVTAAPDLLFLKDNDGDGVADERQVIYTGFAPANPQHRVNSPTLALDNWIYCADGDSIDGVRPGNRTDTQPFALRGSDFRFHFRPGFREITFVAGRGQYGVTFDDWGNRFVNHNSIHIRYPVLRHEYLWRNPFLAVPEVIDEIANDGKPVHVYPASKLEPRMNDPWAAGYFTSACGPLVYRGDGLPPEYRGNVFACEPVHNLVHRDVLEPNGVSFRARNPHEGREFFASTDNWCRPVQLANGPDGALYVVDMYRAVIEHPQWIPLDLQKRIDLRAGEDKGRIFRIVPRNGLPLAKPSLHSAKPAQLVELLNHPNAWWRETAQRLLVEQGGSTALDMLRVLAQQGKTAVTRVHALWTLDGLSALEDGDVARALADSDPRVRVHALRLADTRLYGSDMLKGPAVKLADDPDPRVHFQAALTLGQAPSEVTLAALARIVTRHGSDRWVRLAVLTGPRKWGAELLAEIVHRHPAFLTGSAEGALEFVRQLSDMIGASGDAQSIRELVRVCMQTPGLVPMDWQVAVLSGLGDRLRRSGTGLGKYVTDEQITARLEAWADRAARVAADGKQPVDKRLDALKLVALFPVPGAAAQLEALLRPQEPQQVQLAALQALAALPGNSERVLADWSTRPGTLRREALNLLLARPDGVEVLLAALEKGTVRPDDFDVARRDRLLRYPDATVRDRARKLLDVPRTTNRQKLLDEMAPKVLALTGDAARGQKVYAAHCAVCHRLHGQGVAVGPDLASVNNRTKEALLIDILDPNRAVEPIYMDYVVVTSGGQVVTGIIGAESATTLTLRRAERQETTVLRKDVEEIRSTNVSLMPEGLEKNLSAQDLADLLELLRRGRLF